MARMKLKQDNTKVILVDEKDNEVGTIDKLEAHVLGLLHRCFSIFIVNSKGDILIQKRSASKYHSPGIWSNTCCSHPLPGESTLHAAHRRLYEEMGVDTSLKEVLTLIYKFELRCGLIEHEFNHVLLGVTDRMPRVNPSEVDDWKWCDPRKLLNDAIENSEKYSEWMTLILNRLINEQYLPIAKNNPRKG
ncbi:isopentenyl-diphosphate Delta-isomerase [Zooshikella sp. RANM57]|uniref:isopentenyl-diphosphate Delta-isomerase n=1 Tax=Zooshikella sp. RANM57 TaxID=3425863 RepID=UPI003D6DDEB6